MKTNLETSSPRTVLFVSHFPTLRMGGQRSMLALIENLDRSRFRPVAVVPSRGDLAEALEKANCPVNVLPLSAISVDRWRTVVSNIRAFRKLYREERVSVVHPDAERDAFVCGIACLGMNTRLLWHARVAGQNRLDPFVTRLADRIVGVSDAVGSRFSPRIREKQYSTVFNGVDLARFRPPENRASTRAKLRLPVDRPILLFAGQILRTKGIEDIIMAMSHLIHGETSSLNPFLVILGEPLQKEYEQSLQTRIRDSGLEKYVRKLGHQENIEEWMGAADILLLSSHRGHEAMGRVIFEAMACGTVPIASDIPGIREAVTADSGILVPQKDPEAIAAAIVELLEDSDRLNRLRSGGLKRAGTTFGIRQHAQRIQEIYEDLLSG